MKWRFVSRIYAALLTIVTFVVSVSFFFANEAYGFGFYAIAVLAVGAPAIAFIGLPLSIVVDKIMERVKIRNKLAWRFIRVGAYAAAGVTGTLVVFLVLSEGRLQEFDIAEYLPFMLLGLYAALLFLTFHAVLELIFNKLTEKYKREE